jgi:hypothetical protein
MKVADFRFRSFSDFAARNRKVRASLVCALAGTLVGCSCLLPPQAGMQSCTGTSGFACFGRMAGRQPIAPKPASFKTDSTSPGIKSAVAAKTEKKSSAHAPDEAHLATKAGKPTTIAARGEPPASRISLPPRSLKTRRQPATSAAAANTTDSPATSGAVANSNTRAIREQVAAATAVAEQMTVVPSVPTPESKANNMGSSDHPETVLRGDAEKTEPAQPNKTDLQVYLLIARPDIQSVSDLTNKTIAIDDGYSASNGNVRIAIAAAGAPEVQLSNGRTKAIDRMISGKVPAAVLTLVSPQAAEGFPDIPGFKIFRVPLSPGSLEARP